MGDDIGAHARQTITVLGGQNDHLHHDRTFRQTVVNIDGGGSLTIGAGGSAAITLTLTDTSAVNLAAGALLAGDALVSDGHIAIDGGFIDLRALTNNGLLTADSAPGTISAGQFTNTGTIDVSTLLTFGAVAGAEAKSDTFINTGTVDIVSGGTFAIDGTITAASLAGFHTSSNGLLKLDGLVQGAGGTIGAGSGFGLQHLEIGGTVKGGTLDIGAQSTRYTNARLDGVTITGAVDLFGKYDSATLLGGWSLASTGTIGVTGIGAKLTIAGSATLDAGTILVGGNTNTRVTSPALHLAGSQTTLTLGTNVTLNVVDGGTIEGAGATLVNNGTFSIQHGNFYSPGCTIQGVTLVNNGQLSVSLGAFVADYAKYLVNTGTLTVNEATIRAYFPAYSQAKTIFSNTGTVLLQGGDLSVGNWSNTGTVILETSNGFTSNLSFADTTLADLARVDNSHGGMIALLGTLDNTGNVLRPGTGMLGSFTTYGTIVGGTIVGAAGLTVGGTLENLTYQGDIIETYAGGFSIDGVLTMTGANGSGLGTIQLGDNCFIDNGRGATPTTIANATILVSGGSINPNNMTFASNDTISITGTYSQFGYNGAFPYGNIDNQGLITVESTAVNTSVYVSRFLNQGTFAVNGAAVRFGGNNFVNAGMLSLLGATASIDNGGSGRIAALITNTGTITLAGGTITEAGLGISLINASTGIISGFGTLSEAMLNNGIIEATGGTLAISQLLAGHGTLDVSAGATLLLTAGNNGNSAAFLGQNATLGLEPMHFAGAIAGYAPTDTIALLATNATSASFVGTTILIALAGGGTLTLDTSTALTGSIGITHDQAGDSLLTYIAGNGINTTVSSPAAQAATPAAPHEPPSGWHTEWTHIGLAAHVAA